MVKTVLLRLMVALVLAVVITVLPLASPVRA